MPRPAPITEGGSADATVRSPDDHARSDASAVAALERAAERVLRRRGARLSPDSDPEVVRHELGAVVAGLRAALQHGSCSLASDPTRARRRLLDALRSEILHDWSEGDGPLLSLMRAFDVAAQALPTGDGDETLAGVLEPDSRDTLREVAHLLRSPMGSLVMMADTLREEQAGPLTAEQKRQLDIIHRAALAVAVTAGDLLTHLGDVDDEDDSSFAVAEVLGEVVHIVGPVAEARSCEVTIAQCVEGEHSGPRLGLTRILLAMALRAIGLARDGVLELGCAADGGGVHFTVRARGLEEPAPGPATDLLRLFRREPDSAVPMLSPHGLGLSAAARMLASLGAELVIETPEKRELLLTFVVPLPLAD